MEKLWIKNYKSVNWPYLPVDKKLKEMANIFSNFLFGSEAAEKAFSAAVESSVSSVETEVADSTEPQIEAGDSSDLEKFFGEYAEEQAATDEQEAAAREAERARLIRMYANSFKDRILKEITNKDWDRLIEGFEKSTTEVDCLFPEVAALYNERVAKALPPSWWTKRAPELRGILNGDLGCVEIILAIVRSEVSQKINVRRQAAASNLLKQVKAAAEELGLSEAEFPHKPLSADKTKEAAIEIGRKCLVLAAARSVRKSLIALRDCKVRIPKRAEQRFFLVTTSSQQKWGTIVMATNQLIQDWQTLEKELCSRPGAPVEKLKKGFFTLTLEERATQAANHCHLNLKEEIDKILAFAAVQP